MVDLLEGLLPGVQRLSPGAGGIVTFRNGIRFYSLSVVPDEDGEIEVRIEDGVYRGYERDGAICSLVNGHWTRRDGGPYDCDIVEFIRCHWDDPRASDLPSHTTP